MWYPVLDGLCAIFQFSTRSGSAAPIAESPLGACGANGSANQTAMALDKLDFMQINAVNGDGSRVDRRRASSSYLGGAPPLSHTHSHTAADSGLIAVREARWRMQAEEAPAAGVCCRRSARCIGSRRAP